MANLALVSSRQPVTSLTLTPCAHDIRNMLATIGCQGRQRGTCADRKGKRNVQ
jgi:hypothetical protein